MKNLEVGEVYSFKLTSGEELVAKVTSGLTLDGDSIQLSDPLSVAPNAQGMGLIPSMFTADLDKSVTLNTNTVAMWGLSDENIRAKYIQATTGIATQSKKIVLG